MLKGLLINAQVRFVCQAALLVSGPLAKVLIHVRVR